MNSEILVEIIKVAPTILWMLFIGVVMFIYRKRIEPLLRRISGIKAFGLEVSFIEEKLDQASEKQAKKISEEENSDLATIEKKIAIGQKDRSQLLRRLDYAAAIIKGAQVLWVDDNPNFNNYEMRLLRSLGISVDTAETTERALQMLVQKKYDAVISDIARAGVRDEGLRFITKMHEQGLYQKTILYTGSLKPLAGTPTGAFAITNRPDDLVHYLIDIFERERGE